MSEPPPPAGEPPQSDGEPAAAEVGSGAVETPGGGQEPPDPFAGPDWQPASPYRSSRHSAGTGEPGTVRVKVSRRKKRLLRRRRRLGWVMLGLGGLVVLAAAWLVITALMARGEIDQLRTGVQRLHAQISAGDLTAARATAHTVAVHAERAHGLTTGPVWALAAKLPQGGEPLRTVRGITAGLDTLGRDAIPRLISASEDFDPARLRTADGRIDLARLAAVAPALNRATAAMSHALTEVTALPAHTWLPAVDSARRELLDQLGRLSDTVRSADLAARIAPPMLGADGVKHYFVAFQNDAEARGTGGLPGAFAIVSADNGKLRFDRFEADGTLMGTPSGLELGAEFDRLWNNGGNATVDYRNSNMSAHFPYAAQIWAAMWQKYSGQRVDGALAVDPTALSYLLRVTGPAKLPDGTTVRADNVVALTQSTVYARYADDNDARKQYLLDIAAAVSRHLLAGTSDTKALLDAAGKAVGERRLLAWSADPGIEAELEQTALAGAIPKTRAPYVGLAIVNDGGNKLDYYLDRALTWTRTGCGATRDVTVRIALTNNAPASGLSAYVTSRSDRRSYQVQPGDNRLMVNYYATDGALMKSVTIDGRPATARGGAERGHPVFTVDVELPRGQTRVVELHLSEPAGQGAPLVLRQPLVRPLSVNVRDARCD